MFVIYSTEILDIENLKSAFALRSNFESTDTNHLSITLLDLNLNPNIENHLMLTNTLLV